MSTREDLADALDNLTKIREDIEAGYLNGVRDDDADRYTALVLDAASALVNEPLPPGPLLQCIDCRNTESPAGAMARYFNQGRCLHCGGYFKVIRA